MFHTGDGSGHLAVYFPCLANRCSGGVSVGVCCTIFHVLDKLELACQICSQRGTLLFVHPLRTKEVIWGDDGAVGTEWGKCGNSGCNKLQS